MNICEHHDCVGCGACKQVCSSSAITMILNEDGFSEPCIDEDKCIHCNACQRVCPIKKESIVNHGEEISAFAAYLKNDEIFNSTSGGVFYAIAKKVILQDHGVVYGAALGKDLIVRTEKATNLQELEQLRNSKYLQSMILEGLFAEIKGFLTVGRIVLFSGTPCQVSALNSYLGKQYQNLLLVEVFCSSVVSYLPWVKYQKYIENITGKRIVDFKFRKKGEQNKYPSRLMYISPWKSPTVEITFDDGEIVSQTWGDNLWTKAHQLQIMYRDCCANCNFGIASKKNSADISIGDFWGVESSLPALFNDKGTSAVITHTVKGKKALHSVSDDLTIEEVRVSDIRRSNEVCFTHIAVNPMRNVFLGALKEENVSYDIALTEAMGFGRVGIKGKAPAKVGVFGGFNLRTAVLLGTPPFTNTIFHYSNISIATILSTKIEEKDIMFPQNQVRAEMLRKDLQRSYWDEDLLKTLDFLIIDFVEERYNIGILDGSYVTMSDAFHDSNMSVQRILYRISGEVDEAWKMACNKTVDVFKRVFNPDQIVLVKNYLAQNYVDESGNHYLFDKNEVGYDVEKMNEVLDKYYEYFIQQYEGIRVVVPDDRLNSTPKYYKHGRIPSHANSEYINSITSGILKEINYV